MDFPIRRHHTAPGHVVRLRGFLLALLALLPLGGCDPSPSAHEAASMTGSSQEDPSSGPGALKSSPDAGTSSGLSSSGAPRPGPGAGTASSGLPDGLAPGGEGTGAGALENGATGTGGVSGNTPAGSPAGAAAGTAAGSPAGTAAGASSGVSAGSPVGPTISAPPSPPTAAFFQQNLPPGGEYRDGHLLHTIQKGQSLGFVAHRYLPLTDSYTTNQLKKAVIAANSLARPIVSIDQQLEIPGVRTIPVTAVRVPRAPDFPARGIYVTMTSASSERVLNLVKTFKPLGLNTVVIDVKDMDGIIAWKTLNPLAVKTGAASHGTLRDLPKLINLLHAQGIHVVARQVLFHDTWLARHEDRLALKAKDGTPWREHGKQVWVDPANLEVQDYNIALAREAAELGVDEVQFDYIRFPAMGDIASIDYSFDIAKTPKHQIITGFLKRAHAALQPLGTLLSIDVYGVVAWDEGRDVQVTGQRLEDLGLHADIISPMVYPSHFYPPFAGHAYPAWEPYFFVNQGVLKTRKKIAAGGGLAHVRPWLQAFPFMVKDRFNAEYVTSQLRAAHDAGSTGWLLWDARNEYKVGLEGAAAWNAQLETLARGGILPEAAE